MKFLTAGPMLSIIFSTCNKTGKVIITKTHETVTKDGIFPELIVLNDDYPSKTPDETRNLANR